MAIINLTILMIVFGIQTVSVRSEFCKAGDTTGDQNYKHDKGKTDEYSNMLYLLTTSMHKYTCCGLVRHFKSYGSADGKIEYMVWRPTGEKDTYWLANSAEADIKEGKGNSLPPSSHIQIQEGDVMGWYSPGAVTVPYVEREVEGTAMMMQMNPKPKVGDKVDWSNSAKQSNRVYAVESVLVEATVKPDFKNIRPSMSLPADTPVGTRVYTLNVHDPGMADTVVTMADNTYFTIDSTDARSIMVKAPLAIGSFEVTVTATDICGLATTESMTINVKEGAKPKTVAMTTREQMTVLTQTPAPIAPKANVSYRILSPFENQKDDSDGWKIGTGVGVVVLLGAAIAIIVWDRWQIFRLKHNGKTTPDTEKGAANGTETDKAKLPVT